MNEITHFLNTKKWKKLLEDYMLKYGFDKQITVLGEECTELTKVVFKIKRFRENQNFLNIKTHNPELYLSFVEEFCDVYIMIREFENYVDPIIAYNILEQKYEKLYNRIIGKDEH